MDFDKYIFKKSISLIIGCLDRDIKSAEKLVNSLKGNKFFLKEIIIVFNNVNNKNKKNCISKLKIPKDLCKTLVYKKKLMPGDARNIGIDESNGEFIAFLDASTFPEDSWLEKSLYTIMFNNIQGVLGKTKYLSSNSFERSFIAATYGEKELTTVPGALIKKTLLNKIGYFLPNLRSGEDSEWIKRVSEIEKNIIQRNVGLVFYEAIINKSLIYLCKKWFLYYSKSAQNYNVDVERQRFFYLSFFSLWILTITFFWNDVFADWNDESLLYLPNITKITLFILSLLYLITRLIIIPKKKQIIFRKYSFIEIIKFIFISILLDVIKLFAFVKTIIKIF
tara:strand:- start:227 stop:1234 length:1008 start_codon:yes stop_codon:yes gene_type:complete